MDTRIDVPLLSLSDILKVDLKFDDAVSIVEGSLREHGEKQVKNPPKPAHSPASGRLH